MVSEQKETWQHRYIQYFYHSNPDWEGGTTEFWDMITTHAKGAKKILEVGCGPGNATTEFLKETFGDLDGLDIDPDAGSNPWISQFHLYDGMNWPMEDNSYDLIVADYVMEHVEAPIRMFHEVERVLKEGGVFLFRTPNLWHYMAMTAHLTPHWFHLLVSKRVRNLDDEIHDPYPTFYRANTEETTDRIAEGVGLEKLEVRLIEKEPMYGLFSRMAFLLGVGYERMVNNIEALRSFRSNLFAAYRKPAR